MMNEHKDLLYDLLPFVYRQKDVDQGYPLKALLRIITEQVNVVKEDISQLYENWFIETCQEWVVPYIGDLVGYEPVHEAGEPGEVETLYGQLRNKILYPRREVANTIHNRRRKGALSLLELIARDVADWPARAVEYFPLLVVTQALNHLQLNRGKTVDLRNRDVLGRLNGPFDELAHTVDIRRPNSYLTSGRYNIPSICLFIWRLPAYSITKAPAYCQDVRGEKYYSFSVLGNDMPLYTNPAKEGEPTQIASELNIPVPIRREVLKSEKYLEDYYGEGKSIQIWKDDKFIASNKIKVADLTEWHYKPRPGDVIIDPVLGRIAFSQQDLPKEGVWVSYFYGFSADIGGGEYRRTLFQPTVYTLGDPQLNVNEIAHPNRLIVKLRDAEEPATQFVKNQCTNATRIKFERFDARKKIHNFLQLRVLIEMNRVLKQENLCQENFVKTLELPNNLIKLIEQKPTGQDLLYVNRLLLETAFPDELTNILKAYQVGKKLEVKTINDALAIWKSEKPRYAIIEIIDNEAYTEQISINLAEGQTLQIRAANRMRPTLRLLDWHTSLLDVMNVGGGPRSRFTLDGLLITGRGIKVEGEIDELNIRHTTLVPGWAINQVCAPVSPNEKSVILYNTKARVTIENSIVGSILVNQNEVDYDPVPISISDSILDATALDDESLSGPGKGTFAHAILNIKRATVIGKIYSHAIELGENSIFASYIQVARRQIGCIRFSYVTPDSRTPRRYNCQPDKVKKEMSEQLQAEGKSQAEIDNAIQSEQFRVVPQFNSTCYCRPEYCQLSNKCADEIKRGADDESEMGAFHDLYQPQREANLRTRLQEYSPAGMNAGIIFVT